MVAMEYEREASITADEREWWKQRLNTLMLVVSDPRVEGELFDPCSGSGALVRIAGRDFVFTAGHVVDGVDHRLLTLVFRNPTLSIPSMPGTDVRELLLQSPGPTNGCADADTVDGGLPVETAASPRVHALICSVTAAAVRGTRSRPSVSSSFVPPAPSLAGAEAVLGSSFGGAIDRDASLTVPGELSTRWALGPARGLVGAHCFAKVRSPRPYLALRSLISARSRRASSSV